MRSARRLVGAVLLVTLAVGCDTTAPLQQETQTASVNISAPSASAQKVDTWETFEDVNSNGTRDTGDGPLFVFCEQTLIGSDPPLPVFGTVNSVPWPFFIRISIVRAGQTEREDITNTVAATNSNFNLSQYDTSEEPLAGGPDRFGGSVTATVTDSGGNSRFFRFTKPKRLTTVNRSVMRNVSALNPLCAILGDCTFLNGICSQGFPGEAVIDLELQPYTFPLGKGDSVRVEVRRSPTAHLRVDPLITTNNPGLNGAFLVNGVRVNVEGDSSAQPLPSDTSFAFSYRSR